MGGGVYCQLIALMSAVRLICNLGDLIKTKEEVIEKIIASDKSGALRHEYNRESKKDDKDSSNDK